MIKVCRSEFAPYEETIYRTIKKKDITAVTIKKNGSIRGTGAKSSRGLILRAYERYKIAKRETLTNLPSVTIVLFIPFTQVMKSNALIPMKLGLTALL